MKPNLLVVVSDLHAGSTTALCPPGVELGDGDSGGGGTYKIGRGQRWLWANWQDFIGRVKAAASGRRVYLVFNGDCTDGDHHESDQLITRRRSLQRQIFAECADPLAQVADRIFVVRGTRTHVHSDEDSIGKDLGAEQAEDKSHSWFGLRLDLGGVLFDITHHASAGRTEWTHGNPANKLAAQAIMRHGKRGWRVPDYVLRAHNHKYHDSFRNYPNCRAILGPAWELRTEYGWRIDADLADIGGMIFAVDGGRVTTVDPVVIYEPAESKVWRDKEK